MQRDGDAETQRNAGNAGDGEIDETHETYDSDDLIKLTGKILTLQAAVDAAINRDMKNVVFNYCRALKQFENDARSGTPLSKTEWSAALSLLYSSLSTVLPDCDFEHLEAEFLMKFPKTRVPLYGNPIDAAIESANASPLPACCNGLGTKSAKLMAVCWYLSFEGVAEFFISTRTISRIIGTKDLFTCASLINALVVKDYLVLERKGSRGGRQATRYSISDKSRAMMQTSGPELAAKFRTEAEASPRFKLVDEKPLCR